MTSGLRSPFDALRQGIENLADRAPVTTEQKHRLQHYTVFLFMGIPTMVGFGIYNLFLGNYLLFGLVSLSCTALMGGWVVLRRIQHGEVVYRINSFFYGLLILYMLAIGGEDGSKILWMYVFPMLIFFLLGTREGVVWCAAAFVIAGGLLEDPFDWFSTYPYGPQFKIRFIITFMMVSTVAFWFQHVRHSYFMKMEDRQAKLEQERQRLEREIEHRRAAERSREEVILDLQAALEKVKTLSGLIPICASCHKIRDDEGFWDQMESYIARHSDAQFSHGICPDCMSRLYPQYRRTAGGE